MFLFGNSDKVCHQARDTIDRSREILEMPRVVDALGHHCAKLVAVAERVEPCRTVGGIVVPRSGWLTREVLPVVSILPGDKVASTMLYPTPGQQQIIEREFGKKITELELNGDFKCMKIELPGNPPVDAITGVRRVSVKGGEACVSGRPQIVINGLSMPPRQAVCLIHEFSHAGDRLFEPVSSEAIQEFRLRTELAAYAIEAVVQEALAKEPLVVRKKYLGVFYDSVRKIEDLRRKINGPMDGEQAFDPNPEIRRAIVEAGLGRAIGE